MKKRLPPHGASLPGRGSLVVSIAVILWCLPAARGDVVTTVDERRFEGTIVESNDAMVRIDAMVAGVRVKIGIPRRDVKSVDVTPLPENFYTPVSRPAKRVSDPKKFKANSKLYLEVPIVGRFGIQIVPEGIKRCLSYAAAHKIPNIVFFVDSQGGDQVAAGEIYDLLTRYDKRINYHALVRDSVGVAMAVTVWCDNIFLLPGANLGGVALVFQKDRHDGDPAILLSQIAHDVGRVGEERGWPIGVVQAMIDPAARIAAWVDEDGQVVAGVRAPASVSKKKMIVRDRRESVLTLTRTQAVKLGVARKYSGTVAQLGPKLGIEAWSRESDYGRTAMFKAAKNQRQRLERTASKNAATIKKLLQRRQTTKRYIERNLTLAHKWDSAQKPYATYREHSRSWSSYWGGDPLTGTTKRREWQRRTNTVLAYLRQARKGVREMEKLESKAEGLGLDREYEEGQLLKIKDDIDVKIIYLTVLQRQRARDR